MKKVLLTGATGFIGRHAISKLLEKDYEVHAVFNSAEPLTSRNPALFWHRCNLLSSKEQMLLLSKIKPSHLLHFAWYTTPGKYWMSLENLRWVQSSLALLMNFAAVNGRRAVLAGTCAEYDWSYGYCSEKVTPLNPSTLYGACKCSLQQMLSFALKPLELSCAWGRIFFVYGPHEHPDRLVPTVITSLLKGKVAKCSHGKQIRDFLFVEDAASAFVALLESSVEGPVNIASGEPVAVRSIVEKIAGYLNHPELIDFGAVPVPAGDPAFLAADVSRLRQELHWSPTYTMESGLKQTIDWWQYNC